MPDRIQFQRSASVVSASGQVVGRIGRVVVDPQTKTVTHIVVGKGIQIAQDRLVPLHLIAAATDKQITLQPEAGDLYTLPVFEAASPPGAPESESLAGPDGQGEQTLPRGAVALRTGARVVTADGRRAGRIERILVGPDANQATHLLIVQGLRTKARRLIPITWVNRVREDEVCLSVEQKMLERLSANRRERN
jgi:sporulation protein YlmC with PRC-barrel domain